jgi:hypothetical protein
VKHFKFNLQLKLLVVTASILGHQKLANRLQISNFALYIHNLARGIIALLSAETYQIQIHDFQAKRTSTVGTAAAIC